MNENDMQRYADMLMLPHHKSKRHKQMSMAERAAQFSPFAALSGYDAAVKETARKTQEKRELSEEEKILLDQQILLLLENEEIHPQITVVYFKPDGLKSGGSYVSYTGLLRKINTDKGLLIFEDKTAVAFSDIFSLQSDFFESYNL